MKKTILSVLSVLFALSSFAQTLTQANVTSVLVPKVMAQGSGRIPTVYRLTINGLAPNTLYRYNSSMALRTDIGTASSGAGVPFYMNAAGWFGGSGGFGLSTLGQYDSLTTDGTGSYTGWFGLIHSTNTRFNAGNYLFPVITLDSAGSARGTVKLRLAATDSIQALAVTTTNNATSATAISSSLTAAISKNFVCLYDTIIGGRPISIAPIESSGVTIGSVASFYPTGTNGSWATIIPNVLPSGVRKIEQRGFVNGNIINGSTSSNGTWGSINTVNPASGTTPIAIAAANAPLPVKLLNFSAEIDNNQTNLFWSTAAEVNNKGFELQRSLDGKNFTSVTFVKGAGNTNRVTRYNFKDNNNSSAYYRLKQLDFDGQFEYSNTIKVVNSELSIELSPNPFNENIEINSLTPILNAEIIDITGKVKIIEIANSNKLNINTSELGKGVYFIRINNGENVISKRIIKN